MQENRLTTSYFGLFSRHYYLTEFMRFEIINYKDGSFISKGIDIKMLLYEGSKIDLVLLFKHINRKKVVDLILNDLREIMNKEVPLSKKNIDRLTD